MTLNYFFRFKTKNETGIRTRDRRPGRSRSPGVPDDPWLGVSTPVAKTEFRRPVQCPRHLVQRKLAATAAGQRATNTTFIGSTCLPLASTG